MSVGRWAPVAAGSVVVHDVPDHALVGGVPAGQLGWVGQTGRPLEDDGTGLLACPDTGDRVMKHDGALTVVAATENGSAS